MIVRNVDAWRGIEKNVLVQGSIQECALDVNLVKSKVSLKGKDDKDAQRYQFSCGSVRFPVVHAFDLLKTFCAQSRFVFDWDIELVLFDLENPSAINSFLIALFLNNNPHIMLVHVCDLFFNGFLPEGGIL